MVDSALLVPALALGLGSFAGSSALGAIGVLAVRKGHLPDAGRGLALAFGVLSLGLAGLAEPVTAPIILGGTIGAGGMGVGAGLIGSEAAQKVRRALQ